MIEGTMNNKLRIYTFKETAEVRIAGVRYTWRLKGRKTCILLRIDGSIAAALLLSLPMLNQ